MNFSAVILAGGNSSRMGFDKSRMRFGDHSLLEWQLEKATEAGASEVLVSGREGVDYSGLGCGVVRDRFKGCGPLGGIEAALGVSTAPLLLVLAVDMPHVSVDLLRHLLSKCSPGVGVVPVADGQLQPLAAVYPVSCRAFAEILIHDRRLAVRTFVSVCANAGAVQMVALPARFARGMANWNSPAEVRFSPTS